MLENMTQFYNRLIDNIEIQDRQTEQGEAVHD